MLAADKSCGMKVSDLNIDLLFTAAAVRDELQILCPKNFFFFFSILNKHISLAFSSFLCQRLTSYKYSYFFSILY